MVGDVSRWIALGAFVTLLAPAHALAQSVETGQRLYLEAEFDQAVEELQAVLAKPSLSRDEAVEAHRYLAALFSVLRDEGAAASHAEAAVALDPAASPPAGAPSRVAELFDTARTYTDGARARLRLDVDGAVADGETTAFRLSLSPAPEAMAAELRLRCVSGTESAEESGPPTELLLSLRVAGAEVNCRGGAHTRAGAALLTISEDFEIGESESGGGLPDRREDEDDSEGGSLLPWLLVGGGVLVAAAVVIAVLLVTSSSDTATLREPQIEGW